MPLLCVCVCARGIFSTCITGEAQSANHEMEVAYYPTPRGEMLQATLEFHQWKYRLSVPQHSQRPWLQHLTQHWLRLQESAMAQVTLVGLQAPCFPGPDCPCFSAQQGHQVRNSPDSVSYEVQDGRRRSGVPKLLLKEGNSKRPLKANWITVSLMRFSRVPGSQCPGTPDRPHKEPPTWKGGLDQPNGGISSTGDSPHRRTDPQSPRPALHCADWCPQCQTQCSAEPRVSCTETSRPAPEPKRWRK